MKPYLLLLLLLNLLITASVKASNSISKEQLSIEIENILKETKTKGVAISLIEADGNIWSYTAGLADIKAGTKITPTTQFRMGSISKIFVAMAILRLVDQNKLSLNDTLASIAPEIEFYNPWEQQNPVTVAHLIEHTTGWDAPHFSEQISNTVQPIEILTALNRHPHSRTSRWVPGSRTAYNNTGPTVAAYLVEKITGLKFETFVKQHFLLPLSMIDTDYFYTDNYVKNAAKLYRGQKEQPYAHLVYRASGAINSNLNDMTTFANFLINHQNMHDINLLSDNAFTLMEKPFSSLAAHADLELGYGLGLTMFHHNGYLYFGHEGALPGANSILAYQKELRVAHVIMTNSESSAVSLLHKLLANYQSQNTTKIPVNNARKPNENDIVLSGFYRAVSPISNFAAVFQLFTPWQLNVSESQTWIKPLIGGKKRELALTLDGKYRQNSTGKIALVNGQDPLIGKVLHYGPQTLKKINMLAAYTPLITLLVWFICALISLIFMLIWLPRFLLKRIDSGATIDIRLWPLLSCISVVLLITVVLFIKNNTHTMALAGTVNFASILVMLLTLVFTITNLYGSYIVIRNYKAKINRFVYWHSALYCVVSCILTFYLASYDLIAIKLWQ